MEACKRLNMPVEKYLVAKEYCNEVSALYAMSEFFCIPAVELDMLDIDKELFDKFSFDFMKKHKVVPVCRDKRERCFSPWADRWTCVPSPPCRRCLCVRWTS